MGTNLAFLKQLQRRIAQAAIGPSSLRKQGASKVIERARTFVNQIDLAQVSAFVAAKLTALALDNDSEEVGTNPV